MEYLFLILLFTANIIAFALYGIDKAKAKLDSWRISEKNLLIWSFIGGIGGMVGMNTFRHKTLKPKFKAVNTVGILLNLFLITLLLLD